MHFIPVLKAYLNPCCPFCMEALVLMMGMGFLSLVLPKFIQALGVEPAQLRAMVGLVITTLVVLFTEFGLKYLVRCV